MTRTREFSVGESIEKEFLAFDGKVNQGKNGKDYVVVSLIDDDGDTIVGKIWNTSDAPDGVIAITGKMDSWDGNPQIVIDEFEGSDRSPSDFSPQAPWGLNKEVLMDRYLLMRRRISSSKLSEFTYAFIGFCNEGKEDGDDYWSSPGGQRIHHAYKHGLVEHSVEVSELSYEIAKNQKMNQREIDLAIVGGLIHDIGKIDEIDSSGAGYKYSTLGKVFGENPYAHIAIGMLRLSQYVERMAKSSLIEKMDEKTLAIIQNIILSHHGEFGPTDHKFAVSSVVHLADMASSNLNRMRLNLAKADGGSVKSDPIRKSYMAVSDYAKKEEPTENRETQKKTLDELNTSTQRDS